MSTDDLPYPTPPDLPTVMEINDTLAHLLAAAATTTTTGSGNITNPPSDSFTMMIFFLVLSIGIIVVGVLGNAFVVMVIFTDRKLLHSSVNLFLLNLALADAGNLIFITPDIILQHFKQPWLLPDLLCPVIRFLQVYFLFASVLLQMSIGIERYMAICTPLQMQRFSRRTTVFFLLCAWSVAAFFAMPGALYMRVLYTKNTPICRNTLEYYQSTARKVMDDINFVVLYCIPLVLLTTLYTIMCRRLWIKESMIAGESQQMAILRLRRSVVKMLVISMLIYFICYTPIQSTAVFKVRISSKTISDCFNILVFASSAANPIVYIMCCRHFHQRFVSMVHNIIHCCPRTPEKYQTVITDADKSSTVKAGKPMSRSPYVSFRRSTRRPKQQLHQQTLSVTLL